MTDGWTCNSFGEPSSYQAQVSGTPLFGQSYTRDAGGRITQKSETISAVTSAYTYGYDTAGRLTTVTKDSTPLSSYTYDANGNRLAKTTPTSTEVGTYDTQDRLLTYNGAAYSYTANGELQSKTDTSGATTYSYDELGNLLSVSKPDGTLIEYTIDAQNRRTGKKVNGTLVRQYLYADALRIAAELDGSGNIVSRFIYATRSNSPDVIQSGGAIYRIVSDHLGSPRLVVNPFSGDIIERVDYDEFGNVVNDTNPGFQPFGFAGGLYDADTKLVRFGARDYDAQLGRWTGKEPLMFNGGDSNFYSYVFDDPIQMLDPTGDDALCYDGTTMWLSNDAGQTLLARPATSGREGVTDPTVTDKGPVPPGMYAVLPPEISEVHGASYVARNLLGDWGHYRVPLHPLPGTETYGRSGFFIHGGRFPGSAGCVDVGSSEDEFFKRLKQNQGPLALRVGKCR